MDVGKFRLGGELSDIEVVVNGKKLQLHRFPLYTRSNFFLKEFAKLTLTNSIALESFPGGIDMFTIIADYCYNISVDITVDNVVGLRCGAKYLEMYGSGNLYEKTGVLIEEILSNARKGKDLPLLVKLIASIPKYKTNETTKHALDQCCSALVHYWNKTQFSTTAIEQIKRKDILAIFMHMEFEFFISLLKILKRKSTNSDALDALVSEYILQDLDGDAVNSCNGKELEVSDKETETRVLESGQAGSTELPVAFSSEKLERVQKLLDDIQPNISQGAASKWLKPLLEAYSQVDGSDIVLGSIAAAMVNQVDGDSILKMSEDALISFAEKVNPANLSELTKDLIAENLVKRVDADHLTAAGFMKIIRRLELHQASCQDNLLYVLSLLNSKSDGLGEADLKECLAMINMKNCSVKALRHAQQTNSIPADLVLIAALDLCEKLQEKYDASAQIIQDQEKEISSLMLDNFGMLRNDVSPQRHLKQVRVSSHSNFYASPTRSDSRSGSSSSTSNGRTVDGLWSDHTLTQSTNSLQEHNPKLSEYLHRQRQTKLWK